MLQNSFCHIGGLGPKTENKLWSSGFRSWDAVRSGGSLPLSQRKALILKKQVRISITELATGNVDHFYNALPSNEQWRLYREFSHSVAYLDIETTGLGEPGDYITTIAMFDGRTIKYFVHGENLEAFAHAISNYRLIVTYNGKTFDVPFIRRYLGLRMDQAHIDLRYVLASLGYRGGLKECERHLGLKREELADVDGFFAVLLWNNFKRDRNRRALETLLAYNITDTVNLATLMTKAYNLKLKGTPFLRSHQLPTVTIPDIPFKADADTIAKIQRKYYG